MLQLHKLHIYALKCKIYSSEYAKDTTGTQLAVLHEFRGRFVHSYICVFGTADSAIIREVSLFRLPFIERFHCTHCMKCSQNQAIDCHIGHMSSMADHNIHLKKVSG